MKSAAMIKKMFGSKHVTYATVLNSMALLYNALGQTDKTTMLLLEASSIVKHQTGKYSLRYATSLTNLSTLLQDTASRRWALTEALNITEALVGTQHAAYINKLSHLISFYIESGNLAAAKEALNSGLHLTRTLYGEHSLNYASMIRSVGKVHEASQDYLLAEQSLKKAYTIAMEAGDTSTFSIAPYEYALADFFTTTMRLDSAEHYLASYHKLLFSKVQSIAIMRFCSLKA
ncbi:MAG: hypothetical protein EOO03_18505 [Chitinophagaceae bacterium]|nr:MAG: hypothetical protein EOO03_18505 [Chitinophagaceae bacterium]